LGGAVKGFKDGMKDGSATPEENPAAPAQQVTGASPANAEKSTIDVEAKSKS
jgi:sec-independent protein translocase protein TatA